MVSAECDDATHMLMLVVCVCVVFCRLLVGLLSLLSSKGILQWK